jgi:ABC-2 type transport system permease protein
VNYFPALHILDKADPLGAPSFFRFASPLVAMASAIVAGLVWRTSVRHYRSTGS